MSMLMPQVIWKTRTPDNADTGQRGHGHVKNTEKKAIKAENQKKSYHPFYKVAILCDIVVRVTVKVRVRVSMLSVSALSVSALSGVRVFQITYVAHFTAFLCFVFC